MKNVVDDLEVGFGGDSDRGYGRREEEEVVELRLKGERSFLRSELLLYPRKIQHLAHLLYTALNGFSIKS